MYDIGDRVRFKYRTLRGNWLYSIGNIITTTKTSGAMIYSIQTDNNKVMTGVPEENILQKITTVKVAGQPGLF